MEIKNNFLQIDNVINRLKKECNWITFMIGDRELDRPGCFEGDVIDGIEPWIRCPSIQDQKIYEFSPIVREIRDHINPELNIAKLQLYGNGGITIGQHSDKILDLDEDAPIVFVRFGATRNVILKNKTTKETRIVPMEHNSCLTLSYDFNREWTHGIQKSDTEDESYSIVFRKTVTFKHPKQFVLRHLVDGKMKVQTFRFLYGTRTLFPTRESLENYPSNSIPDGLSYNETRNKIIPLYVEENKRPVDLSHYKDIIGKSGILYP